MGSETKITKTVEAVRMILSEFPETRDNDRLLILKIWAAQEKQLRDEGYSFMRFAKKFLDGNFIDTETVRRCRQKLQEMQPGLRGKSYRTRHDKAAPEYKQELNEIR
jgi:hypothetical protein